MGNILENEFINAVNVADLLLNIINYKENLTQSDKSEILQNSQNISQEVISKIENHLEEQDKKINEILKLLKGD